MNEWELIDCLEPLEEGCVNPAISIRSETQLIEVLDCLRKRRHGHVLLASPEKDSLSISIGGPFVSFGWLPSPVERRFKGQKEALTAKQYSPEPVESWSEGIPTAISPEFLFPVGQAIDAIIYFYNNHELPRWISWREWDPVRLQWTVTPAEVPAQPVSTPKSCLPTAPATVSSHPS